MGCGGSKNAQSKKIDKQLKKDQETLEQTIKLLLLGAGESGKSTVAKQMKIIHMEGFSEEERKTYVSIIHSNVLLSMRNMLAAAKTFEVELEEGELKEAGDRMLSEDPEFFTGPLTAQMAADCKKLWSSEAVQGVYKRRAEYQLFDSTGYYLDKVEEISADEYLPSPQDVLRSRAKTTGIIETEFEANGVKFLMCDVGGQRSERKKWMHCFQDVTACIFCVALSAYDQKLYEDDSTNRMHESLKLFKEIANSKWFVETSMILFLNKRDLFAEKIKKVDLKVCWPEYSGGCDFDAGIDFITQKFLSQCESPNKAIYPHVTCATDTDNVQVVFNAVSDIVLRSVLNSSVF